MLFSHIRVCDQPHDAELAKHFLHFSGQTALHLQTELYGRSKANREELSALLSNHAHRIATMCSNRHLMVEIYHSMNNLRSIEIRPGNFHQTRSENFIKYPLPSSLTRLIFTSEAFSHTSPQEFLSAIGGLSLLQELQIVDPLLSEAWRYLPHTTWSRPQYIHAGRESLRTRLSFICDQWRVFVLSVWSLAWASRARHVRRRRYERNVVPGHFLDTKAGAEEQKGKAKLPRIRSRLQ